MAQANILVVDDDPVSLKTVSGLLKTDGYTVSSTASGHEALATIRSGAAVDLALLDVVLPDVSGIEVCREIKRGVDTRAIPVILISAFRKDDSSVREGLEAGADGYLLKPVEDVALRAWVRAALRIRALQKDLDHARAKNGVSIEEVLHTFARLSHAVNNPLQAVYASADMLGLQWESDAESKARIDTIMQSAEKTSRLVAEASLQADTLLRTIARDSVENAPS